MQQAPLTMHNKICLVTGATSGIGLGTARGLARLGAHVVLVGRDRAKTDQVGAEIQAETGDRNVASFLADLSVQDQIRELAGRFQDRYGRLDVLVNNAGGAWVRR